MVATLQGHTRYVNSITFSPDGNYLATGSKDKTIKLWSIETLKEVATLQGHNDSVLSVAFSPDSKHIASSNSDKTVQL
jgi:WD40 repeat protein